MRLRFSAGLVAGALTAFGACSQGQPSGASAQPQATFAQERAQHHTSVAYQSSFGGAPMPEPPHDVFLKVHYPAAPGALGAYLSPDPKDGRRHLAHQPYVDPNRIYLGGHSTGGTLALMTAEASDRFRAVFAFGPVSDVRG